MNECLECINYREAIVNFDEENFRQWVAINLWGARVVKSSMRTTWVEEKELEDFLVNAVKESLDKKVLKESKKIEIPKNVAEWIEELKSYSDVDIFEEVEDIRGVLSSQNMHKEHAIWGWIEGHKDDFMRAWLEHPNIAVEKEQLYYVELPALIWNDDASELEGIKFYLKYRVESDEFTLSSRKENMMGWRGKLTEQEIKSIDKNYWAFAKAAEEEDE